MAIKYSYNKDEFNNRFVEKYDIVANAATDAAKETAVTLKQRARANIAAAGFSQRWQNTLRVETYPKNKISARPAIFLFHKIPYSEVFESGAIIRSNNLLWLPLPSTPKRTGNKRITPKVLAAKGVKLVSITGGRIPLLGARLALSSAQMKEKRPQLSITQLKSASSMSRRGAPSRTVPLFFGLSSVTLRKRFDIAQITRSEAKKLHDRYLKHFRDV